MPANFQILESHLSETEMALLMAINVTMNAALLAGASPDQLITHLDQHERNFAALKQGKAENIMAVLQALVRNATSR